MAEGHGHSLPDIPSGVEPGWQPCTVHGPLPSLSHSPNPTCACRVQLPNKRCAQILVLRCASWVIRPGAGNTPYRGAYQTAFDSPVFWPMSSMRTGPRSLSGTHGIMISMKEGALACPRLFFANELEDSFAQNLLLSRGGLFQRVT